MIVSIPFILVFGVIDLIFNQENIDKTSDKFFKWLDK